MSITEQASAPIPASEGGPVPDDRTAVAMFTVHRLDEAAQQLAHAAERLQAARGASGGLRAYHSGHVARHLQDALGAGHMLAANLRTWYPAEGAELDKTTEAIGLARGYELNPRSGMISLDLPPGTIAPVPDGVRSHHITVVYLGPDMDDEAFAQALDRARTAAAAMPGPLTGTVGGIGTFPPSGGSGGKVPAWAGVVLPGAERIRSTLEDLSASEHPDWQPHVTLAYVEPGEPLPDPVPQTPVTFTHLSVHRGDSEVARFPLGGGPAVTENTAAGGGISLAKALSEDAKAATTAHLLQTVLYDAGHAARHAQSMLDEPSPDLWEFNADHCAKHLDGAHEHVAKLADHLRDNYPAEGRWLAGLAAAELAGTISGQLVDLGHWDGWRHELRDAHGRWTRTPGAAARPLDARHFMTEANTPRIPERETRANLLPWHADGDVMHYHGSLGTDRKDMPQISGTLADGRYAPSSEMMPKFLDHLKAKGVTVTHERVPASSLKPTQTTGDMRAVRGIAGSLASGELKDTKPVLVSSDGRVVDGHHQWAAHILGESEGTRTGSAPGEPVIRADLPADKLMAEARQFAKDQGIQNRKTGVAANPEYARPSIAAQAEPEDTMEKYQRPDGTFTPERAALHKRIIDGILAGHKPQEHPVATFFGGGPAAGKSTALKATPQDTAHIDPDEIKAQLPEYRQMLDAGDPKAAGFVHEESSYLSMQAKKQAEARRLNYTLDGTGDSDIAKMAGKVNDARRSGYMTEGKYVTVGTDEAVRRAEARAQATGRHVPETFIRKTHAAVSDAYARAAKMGLFDKTELWDTSGSTPALVAHKEPGGQFQVDDPGAWQRFLDKAGEGQS